MLQLMNIESIMLNERRQTQRPRIVWLFLFEMSRLGKFIEKVKSFFLGKGLWKGS